MNHTSGPWNVYGPMSTALSSEYYCVGSSEKKVCKTGDSTEINIPNNLEEQFANAKLIASAPDLLIENNILRAALQEIVEIGSSENGCCAGCGSVALAALKI